MRKWNNILSRVILILLFLHALMGSLMLLGINTITLKPLSWLLLILVVVHGILGVFSTIQALKNGRASGRWYMKANAGFWTKRVSGMVILLMLIFHVSAYTTSVNGIFFLKAFTVWKMIAQFVLMIAIFVHLAVSIKSMLIARGVLQFKERTVDWLLVLSLLTLFFAAAVIVYYIQWQI